MIASLFMIFFGRSSTGNWTVITPDGGVWTIIPPA